MLKAFLFVLSIASKKAWTSFSCGPVIRSTRDRGKGGPNGVGGHCLCSHYTQQTFHKQSLVLNGLYCRHTDRLLMPTATRVVGRQPPITVSLSGIAPGTRVMSLTTA